MAFKKNPLEQTNREALTVRVGENVKTHRRLSYLSQEELARRAGLHRTEIGMIEHGLRTMRIDTALKLATALHVSLDFLVEGVKWNPPVKVGETGRFETHRTEPVGRRDEEDPSGWSRAH